MFMKLPICCIQKSCKNKGKRNKDAATEQMIETKRENVNGITSILIL